MPGIPADPLSSSSLSRPLTTILLVDGNAPMRTLVRRMLQHHGYLVLEVSAPEDLIALPGVERIHFDALVAGLTLPRSSGPDFADRLTELGRQVPALYYSSVSCYPGRELGPREALLLMPFGMSEFMTKLKALMAGTDRPQESRRPPVRPSHLLKLYETPEDLGKTVAPFLAEGLKRGERAMVITTPEHWKAIAAALEQGGSDPTAAKDHGKLEVLDAHAVLRTLDSGSGLDLATMTGLVAPIVGRAAGPHRIYGELVDLLWQRDQLRTAVALEEVWNRHLDAVRHRLLCGYHRNLVKSAERQGIVQVLETHSHVVLA